MKWLRNWWWARQRAMDMEILWPQCKQLARDLDHAKAAFMVHAVNDPCWVCYYGDKLWETVNALT